MRAIVTEQAAAIATPARGGPPIAVASFKARLGGYVVDMVIFTAIAMIMLVIAGVVLLVATDVGTADPSDPDLYAFLGIVGLGTPVAWSLLNLALLATRRQTGGQYVAGLQLGREDGRPLSGRDRAAWWFCLNPLLFSWPMAAVAGLPLSAVVALVLRQWTFVALGAIVLLCILMPVVSAAAALLDARNRTLHDRIVGTVVAPAE